MSLDGRIGSTSHSTWIDGGGGGASSSAAPLPGSASAAALGSGPRQQTETLDEPVSATILRDVRRVGVKLKHVLIPRDTVKELRDWDLWGPLILCLLLASTLSLSNSSQSALIFAAVFVIVWVGAGIITLNAALLGGQISFLQSVCVLGYCLAPLNLASILCHLWPSNKIFHFVVVMAAFGWSTRASVGFMAQLLEENKKALGVYPVLLFYLSIAWMILVQ